jgi:hypothetical protein
MRLRPLIARTSTTLIKGYDDKQEIFLPGFMLGFPGRQVTKKDGSND